MKDFIGVDLSAIKRIVIKPDELGYGRPGIPLDHYFWDIHAPLDVFDATKPQAALNISFGQNPLTVAYVDKRWFDNIETVENEPPGWERIILTWLDSQIDNGGPYDN